ncbi:ATP-binding protein [Paracoccus sp. Z118]|uniref:AAA family ATPase n=1 Tax=Paracoccus sp. Z118 TaxID=2851017 RepID=UPI001C2C902B|nr:AAA family ATPase [Paracoccus sp. Z118]MBV0892182.1 ATP-binding protein [Paracoccus sp. Z118]
MPYISIQRFSCIKKADLEIADINIIIGEQGSGKSVTTKLIYFFGDLFSDFIRAAEDQTPLEHYKKEVARRFTTWFPPGAWGGINFKFPSGRVTRHSG